MSKRRRRKTTRPRLSPAQMVRPEGGAEAPAPVTPSVREVQAPATRKALPDLREEYPYVVTDLRRVGIIALVMMVLLIGLAVLLV